jgi:hypothetical protein
VHCAAAANEDNAAERMSMRLTRVRARAAPATQKFELSADIPSHKADNNNTSHVTCRLASTEKQEELFGRNGTIEYVASSE